MRAMRPSAVYLAVISLIAGLVTVAPAAPTMDAYQRAVRVVDSALEALSGPGVLERAGGVVITGEGTRDLRVSMQGMRPDVGGPVHVREVLAVDPVSGTVAWESHGRVNPDADEWMRFVHDADGRMLIVDRINEAAFWDTGAHVADQRRRYARVLPRVLLEEALERRKTLRSLGRARAGGAECEAVTWTLESGEALTAFIDDDAGRVRAVEYLLDMPLSGDTVVRWEYGEYRDVEDLGPVPSGYRILVGGDVLKDVRFTAITAGSDVLGAPLGIEVPEPPPVAPPAAAPEAPEDDAPEENATAAPPVRELAAGVYLVPNVRDGFHVLFVEFDDFVVAVDAPAGYHELQMLPAIDWAGPDVTSSSVGRRFLDAIHAAVPGKPVRYVVLTHHHGDHLGGVRPFVAAGATVITSATAAPAVQACVRAPFTLEPDELTGRDVVPDIEVVDGERVIEDGTMGLRVLDMGDNPHAEGLLAIHLPAQGILYVCDVFEPLPERVFPNKARVPVMRWFVDWLDGSGIDAGRIYAIHGSARVTEEQLRTIRGWSG